MHIESIAVTMAILSASLVGAAPIEDARTNSTLAAFERFKPKLQSPGVNEQSCICRDPSKWDAAYTCQIGVDWYNGKGCESIRKNLRNTLTKFNSNGDNYWNDVYWKCYAGSQNDAGGFKNTQIEFGTGQGMSSNFNPVLQAFWPMVNSFNCPDY